MGRSGASATGSALGSSASSSAFFGCLSAAAVAILDVDPPPVVVPYDPETGFALPEASVGATSVTANQAIIEAEVFRYVTDREVYNQLDNDLRIRSVSAPVGQGCRERVTPDLEQRQ